MIDQAIQQQAGFKIDDLDAEAAAKECEVPVFFLHGKSDDFVVPDNSQKNHDAYAGPKKSIKFVDGDHNSERPKEAIDEIKKFFKENL